MSAREFFSISTKRSEGGHAVAPIREIIWLTPQQIFEARLAHEIDEIESGKRPEFSLTRGARREAIAKNPHHNAA